VRRHPGLFSFGVAVVVLIAYLMVSMGSNKNVDATTWILAFGFVGFPFVWLGVFAVVSTAAWFQDATGRAPKEDDEAHEETGAPKKRGKRKKRRRS
jgi:hypothetical protein